MGNLVILECKMVVKGTSKVGGLRGNFFTYDVLYPLDKGLTETNEVTNAYLVEKTLKEEIFYDVECSIFLKAVPIPDENFVYKINTIDVSMTEQNYKIFKRKNKIKMILGD